jgi:parallel beta-helix repeat protein
MFGWVGAGAASESSCSTAERVVGQVRLRSDCTYRQGFVITSNGASLDCNGATIDGEGRRVIGVRIDSEGRPLSGVNVRNCRIRNFTSSAVRVTWDAPDAAKPNDTTARSERTPQGVTLTGLQITNIGRVAVYFDDYVQRSLLENSMVEQSGGPAVYLEFGTRDIDIRNNVFQQNGFNLRREALAVDSSSNNRIVGNTFVGNRLGGIFLYKNCGEHSSDGRSVPRVEHSDNNQIIDNRFVREKVGVWIASRQSRNLRKWDCSDTPMDGQGKYFEDFANRNVLEGNFFCANDVGVRIEGDENRVQRNYFDAKTRKRVEVPVTKRGELLKRPPAGNLLDEGQSGDAVCSQLRY